MSAPVKPPDEPVQAGREDRIHLALTAQLHYDELNPQEQVVALAALAEGMDSPDGHPGLAAWLAQQPFRSEMVNGVVVTHGDRDAATTGDQAER